MSMIHRARSGHPSFSTHHPIPGKSMPPGENPAAASGGRRATRPVAIGCPVCNKPVVGLRGVSGAFSVWAPIQPALAALSMGALLVAVIIRWRGRGCDGQTCAPAPAATRGIETVAPLSR